MFCRRTRLEDVWEPSVELALPFRNATALELPAGCSVVDDLPSIILAVEDCPPSSAFLFLPLAAVAAAFCLASRDGGNVWTL